MTRSKPTAGTPRTAAVVDIGSNAVRMVIADVFPDGAIEVLERTSRPVHLGHDSFVNGRLGQRSINAAITILRDYRKLMDTYEVSMTRAVATSAARDASNGEAFLERIQMTVDVDVEVIDAMEQSRLIVEALRQESDAELGLRRRVALIAEVGGGSTLLTILRRGEISSSQSYNLGSVRMQELLGTPDQPPERAADLMRHHISNTVDLARKSMRLQSMRTFVAIGGDARFAAQRVGKPLGDSVLRSLHMKALDGLLKEMSTMTTDEVAREYNLPTADAETLLPALLVYRALLDSVRTNEIIVSQVSMRDGLLLDLPRYMSGEDDPALTRSIVLSAKTIGAKYRYDAEHAEHVAELATRIFDELQDEHRLGRRDRLLLQVACYLHDIGMFVSNRAHHKHSHYLILQSEIFGLRRDEVEKVAVIARYHRRSMPKESHIEYKSMPRDTRIAVSKLAGILRVADAMDRGHWQQISNFTVERHERELVIYVSGVADLALERRAVAEKGDLFEEMFGLKVRLEEEPATSTA